jgi:glucose-1-phosphate cytidylyltransferase
MKMKVVILAGGLGTRLSEETNIKPKPMVEIGDMPIIYHIMKYYMKFGFNDFIILAGYKHEIIKDYFSKFVLINNDIRIDTKIDKISILNKKKEDFKVTILNTGQNTLTGGRLLRAKKILGKEKLFLMTYGDGLSNVDLKKLVLTHKKNKKIATLTAVSPESKFGDLILSNSLVSKFSEKANNDKWVNAGFFVFTNEIFNYLKNDNTILESDTLSQLAKEKQLAYHKHTGFWKPMDTLNDKNMLNNLWTQKKAPWV